MITRSLNFLADWGLEIDVASSLPEFNPLWEPAYLTILAPYKLAIDMGKMSRDRGLQIEADLYAAACIMGSPTPAFTGFSKLQWSRFLQKTPELFETLRRVCELRVNFDPNAEVRSIGNDETAIPKHDGAGAGTPEEG